MNDQGEVQSSADIEYSYWPQPCPTVAVSNDSPLSVGAREQIIQDSEGCWTHADVHRFWITALVVVGIAILFLMCICEFFCTQRRECQYDEYLSALNDYCNATEAGRDF